MRIKKKVERTGLFWLPAEPDRKVPGRLSISDGGYIELGLIGSLVAFSERVERIIGQIEREGSVTLDECFCTSEKSSQGIEKSLIRVNLACTGILHDEDDVPLINSLIFSVEGIDEWIGISGIKFDHQSEKGSTTLLYQQPRIFHLTLAGDYICQQGITFVNCVPSLLVGQNAAHQRSKDKSENIFQIGFPKPA